MKINLPFNENILPKRFGKEAEPGDVIKNNPVRSFPFEITELPEGTKYVAITLIDYDAIPENYSLDYKNSIKQGKNSFSSPLLGMDFTEIDSIFVGPTPPDKDHRYTIEVFALSDKTGLEDGFYYNELLDSVDSITLDRATAVVIGQF